MSLLHKFAAAVTAAVAFASAPALADVHVSFGLVAPEPQIVIRHAPPPRPYVVRTAAPCDHARWIDGDWQWNGYRYVWVDGYWSTPAGHVHAPPRVVVQRRVVVPRPVIVKRPVHRAYDRGHAYGHGRGHGHGHGHGKHYKHARHRR